MRKLGALIALLSGLLLAAPAQAATEVSITSGNIGTSTTWALIEPNSFTNSNASTVSINSATTYLPAAPTTFTVGGTTTVAGLGIKLASIVASPTGTIKCQIETGGSQVTNAVTGNISLASLQLASSAANDDGGWVFMAFAANATLATATNYGVQCQTSITTQVILQSASATQLSVALYTATNQAPAAGDVFLVTGLWSSGGSLTNNTVTVNTTTLTAYGINWAGYGVITGGTLTVQSTTYGTPVIGETLTDQNNISTGTISSGSGPYTVTNAPIGGATFTSNSSGTTTLNATSRTGTVNVGDLVIGSGIPANTTIVSITAQAGSTGTYVTSASTTTSAAATTAYTHLTSYFGSATPNISISQGGTLAFASAASTNYVMEFNGVMAVYYGGTFTIGTAGTPIPSTSTATLTQNSVAEGDTGIVTKNGGTLNAAGSSGGRGYVKTHLTTEVGGGGAGTATLTSASIGTGNVFTTSVGGTGTIGVGSTIAGTGAPSGMHITGDYWTGATCNASPCTGTGANAGGTYLVACSSPPCTPGSVTGGTATGVTALTTADSTGWLSGDTVYIACSTPVTVQAVASYLGETVTLSGAASGTSITTGAALNYTKSAQQLNYTSSSTNTLYQLNMFPDAVLINRNVKIQGSGTTSNGYLYFQANSNFAAQWVEFYRISGTAVGKRGIEADTGPLGTFSLTNFSIHDSDSSTMVLAPTNNMFGGTSGTPVLIQHGSFYNNVFTLSTAQKNYTLGILTAGWNPNWKIDDVALILNATGSGAYQSLAFFTANFGGTFTNISLTGNGNSNGVAAISLTPQYQGAQSQIGGSVGNTWGPIYSYTNIGYILNMQTGNAGISGTIAGYYIWNDAFAGGIQWYSNAGNMVFDPLYMINSGVGFYSANTGEGVNMTLRNGVVGYTTTPLGNGNGGYIIKSDSIPATWYVDNMEICPFGLTGGVTFVACQTFYINLHADEAPGGAWVPITARVFLRNSSMLNLGTNYPTMNGQEGFFGAHEFITQDCAGCSPVTHAAWIPGGFLSYDTAITHTSGYSLRMTPKVVTMTGYISLGSGLSTAGTTLTLTSGAAQPRPIDFLTSDSGSLVPGTYITGGTGASYPVSQSQLTGTPGSPVHFQSYYPRNGALLRLQSAPDDYGVKVAVAKGASAQVCVWVRPSLNTDAAPPWGGSAVTYNADNPRIVVRQNPNMGVNVETALTTTFTPALTAGTWSQACATTPTAPAAADGEFEIVIDADQTFTSNAGGWMNVAEWSCSGTCNSGNSTQFWWNGTPAQFVGPASAGGGGGGRIIGG
jgi:hypothetical protein